MDETLEGGGGSRGKNQSKEKRKEKKKPAVIASPYGPRGETPQVSGAQ